MHHKRVQAHTSCVTETQKYVEGATKAGGSAANGFYEHKQPKSLSQAVGTEYLSQRPPWQCKLCKVSCTSEATLLAHAKGTKHGRRVRAAQGTTSAPQDADAAHGDDAARASHTDGLRTGNTGAAAPEDTGTQHAGRSAKRQRLQDAAVAGEAPSGAADAETADAAADADKLANSDGPAVQAKRGRAALHDKYAPAKVARRHGMTHASGLLAQTPLSEAILQAVRRRGSISLAKLAKRVGKKHWDKEDITARLLEQVCNTTLRQQLPGPGGASEAQACVKLAGMHANDVMLQLLLPVSPAVQRSTALQNSKLSAATLQVLLMDGQQIVVNVSVIDGGGNSDQMQE